MHEVKKECGAPGSMLSIAECENNVEETATGGDEVTRDTWGMGPRDAPELAQWASSPARLRTGSTWPTPASQQTL
jgi:hypothetical protein